MDVVGLICMCAHSQLAASTACCTPDWENQGLISPWENLVALQNTCMLSYWTITSHDKGI